MTCYDDEAIYYYDEDSENDEGSCIMERIEFWEELLVSYRCQRMDLVSDNALTHRVSFVAPPATTTTTQPSSPLVVVESSQDTPPRFPTRGSASGATTAVPSYYAEEDEEEEERSVSLAEESDDETLVLEDDVVELNPSRWDCCTCPTTIQVAGGSPLDKWASSKRDRAPVMKRNSFDGGFVTMPRSCSRLLTLKDLDYSQVRIALQVFDQARDLLEDFDTSFGLLVLDRLFQLEPRSSYIFYGHGGSKSSGTATSGGKWHAEIHASAFVALLDTVVHMVEADVDFVQEVLAKVSRRHDAVGVEDAFFPLMGQALLEILDEIAPLSREQERAWVDVFQCMSHEILASHSSRRHSC